MATYFADTSFWIGLSRKRDQYHQRAMAWHQFVLPTRSKILTTDAVLLEWLNALSDESTRQMAAEAYLRVQTDAGVEVIQLAGDLMSAGVQLYRGRPDKKWSLTDCISFAVMESRGLEEALTSDQDFEQARLRALMLVPPPV
ncbi:MAG: type II toxin-antitoxin system VapC family toxin [Bryobacterales bacterium]|nr:type II toxin-antitoxin system VapC family toxin [Bryobacterales bacterium]